MKIAAQFCQEYPEISGISATALRPLIREKNDEVKEKVIQKISEDLKGKQHAGRGHKKKITHRDVKSEKAETRRRSEDLSLILFLMKVISPFQHWNRLMKNRKKSAVVVQNFAPPYEKRTEKCERSRLLTYRFN
jgi:hypothetical protein